MIFSGCRGTGPLVESCVYDHEMQGAHCTDKRLEEQDYFRTSAELNNYWMTNPADLKQLLDHCRRNKDDGEK